MKALVRSVASSFAQAITMQAPAAPILFERASQQHGAYVQLLRQILGNVNVIELPADDRYPDCCFIEDTAVVVGQTAIIARIGAGPRQGEEAPVAAALQGLGLSLRHLQAPGLLDGGDVLQLPGSRHILVGLSRRTNEAALQQMQELLPQHQVHGVPVDHGLHLKSACTALDSRTMVYADDDAGRALRNVLQEHPVFNAADRSAQDSSSKGSWQHVLVDPACANLLLPGGNHVVMSSTDCTKSVRVIEQLVRERGLQLHKLQFDEFAKADGALTCCSILLP